MPHLIGMSTNRSFREVDERFHFTLEKEIKRRLTLNQEITVCDVGCGSQATAISCLADFYGLNGIGLDSQLEKEFQGDKLKLVRGDLFDIPFEEVSDITYCAFVLPDISMVDDDKHREKTASAVFQIAKTLRSGGIAFIDERIFTGRPIYLEPLIQEIERQNPRYSNSFETTNNPSLGLINNYLVVRKI